MVITNKLINIFVKDFNIPITVFDRNIFLEQIKILNYSKEWNEYVHILENFATEEDFFTYRNKLQDSVINYIKSLDSYKENIELCNYEFYFLNERVNKDMHLPIKVKIEKNLYTEKNVGKRFISIDMKSANFQVFQQTNAIYDISYESLLNKFDTLCYFHKSKNIRQIIFGNLNPKRTSSIQKQIINILLLKIINNNPNITFDTIIVNNDEIILSYDSKLSFEFLEFSEVDFRIETFVLEKILNKKNKMFYYKRYTDKKVLYTVPKNVYMQAFKKLHEIPLTETDLEFLHEGSIVKFLEPQF